jgi:hypothetical protein
VYVDRTYWANLHADTGAGSRFEHGVQLYYKHAREKD